MLRRRAQRISKFDQTVEAGNNAFGKRKICVSFLEIKIQGAQRVDKKRRPTAHFVTQKVDARARMIERFDNNIFQFVAEELFDGRLILLLDFCIVCEQSDGIKVARARSSTPTCIEELLDSVGGIGALTENLLDGSLAGTERPKAPDDCFRVAEKFPVVRVWRI